MTLNVPIYQMSPEDLRIEIANRQAEIAALEARLKWLGPNPVKKWGWSLPEGYAVFDSVALAAAEVSRFFNDSDALYRIGPIYVPGA